MKPRLDLLIHPGLPKTATTWFQTGLLPELPMVVNIGKGGASLEHGDVRPASRDLRAVQYRVFSEVHDAASMYRRYRSSVPDLIDLRDGAADLIRTQRAIRGIDGRTIVVLSDEALATSGGIGANIGLLAALVEAFREYLAEEFDVRTHVVVTIREQKAWLQSYYAFNHRHLANQYRDVHEFIAGGASDPQDGPFGLVLHDQTLRLLSWTLGDRASVCLVPTEVLRANGGGEFALRLLHFIDDDPDLVAMVRERADALTDVDINASPRTGESTVALTPSRTSTLVHRTAANYARQARGRGPLALLLRSGRHPLSTAYELFRGTRLDDLRAGRETTVELSEADRAIVDAVFAESNASLATATGLPLRELGYHCG